MLPDFRANLRRLIDAKFESRRAFLRAAEASNDENGATGYLSRVLSGHRPPPIERLEAWADALDLVDDERQTFLDLGALENLPASIRPRFVELYTSFKRREALFHIQASEAEALKRLVGTLEQHVATLEAAIQRRGD